MTTRETENGALAAQVTVADSPHSNLLDIWDKFAGAWFGFRGSADGLLGLRVLRSVRTGADGTRARRRGSAAQKQEVYEPQQQSGCPHLTKVVHNKRVVSPSLVPHVISPPNALYKKIA